MNAKSSAEFNEQTNNLYMNLQNIAYVPGPLHTVALLLPLKTILSKCRFFHQSVQFFSVIMLLCLSCQQTIAAEKAKQHHPLLNRIQMLEIPSGEFMMGSHDVMFAKPVHPVRVAAFKLAKNEITYELYDLFVLQTGYDIPVDSWGRGHQPVTNVSWYDVQLFIKWLNSAAMPEKPYRLPTEAEWEYAARAGTQTAYWWGSHKGYNRANCSDCANPWYRQTVPVGTFAANLFGLNDTSGNVYEWTQDCWNSHFEQAPQDGSARLSDYCKYRVIRGGCWYFDHKEMTSASRTWNTATKRDSTIGFRLAQDY